MGKEEKRRKISESKREKRMRRTINGGGTRERETMEE